MVTSYCAESEEMLWRLRERHWIRNVTEDLSDRQNIECGSHAVAYDEANCESHPNASSVIPDLDDASEENNCSGRHNMSFSHIKAQRSVVHVATTRYQ